MCVELYELLAQCAQNIRSTPTHQDITQQLEKQLHKSNLLVDITKASPAGQMLALEQLKLIFTFSWSSPALACRHFNAGL